MKWCKDITRSCVKIKRYEGGFGGVSWLSKTTKEGAFWAYKLFWAWLGFGPAEKEEKK